MHTNKETPKSRELPGACELDAVESDADVVRDDRRALTAEELVGRKFQEMAARAQGCYGSLPRSPWKARLAAAADSPIPTPKCPEGWPDSVISLELRLTHQAAGEASVSRNAQITIDHKVFTTECIFGKICSFDTPIFIHRHARPTSAKLDFIVRSLKFTNPNSDSCSESVGKILTQWQMDWNQDFKFASVRLRSGQSGESLTVKAKLVPPHSRLICLSLRDDSLRWTHRLSVRRHVNGNYEVTLQNVQSSFASLVDGEVAFWTKDNDLNLSEELQVMVHEILTSVTLMYSCSLRDLVRIAASGQPLLFRTGKVKNAEYMVRVRVLGLANKAW